MSNKILQLTLLRILPASKNTHIVACIITMCKCCIMCPVSVCVLVVEWLTFIIIYIIVTWFLLIILVSMLMSNNGMVWSVLYFS